MAKFDPGGAQTFYSLNFQVFYLFNVDEKLCPRMTILQEAAKQT